MARPDIRKYKPKHTGNMPPQLAKWHQAHGIPKSLPKPKAKG